MLIIFVVIPDLIEKNLIDSFSNYGWIQILERGLKRGCVQYILSSISF